MAANFEASEIDDQKIKSLLKNLKIIGSLNQYDKLRTGKGVFIDSSPYTSIIRWFSGENRDANVDFIERVFEDAFSVSIDIIGKLPALTPLKTLHANQTLNRLMSEIHAAQKGVRNLLITYNKDPVCVAKLQILVDFINDIFFIFQAHQERI